MKLWILLDSESNTYIFGESKYLAIIKAVITTLKLITNGSLVTTNQQVNLNNHDNVWYHTKAISNILSLRNVKKKNLIIYDYDNGYKFIYIHTRPGGHDMIFTANKYGLYYNYISNTKGVSMLVTVE